MQNFLDQIFQSQPGAPPLGWDEVLLYLMLSFVLSQLLAWVYSWTHRGLSHSRSMVQSMVLISIIVTAVMLAIGNNLARAFGLFGALALIRFRTPVKDTRDTVFLFMAVGIGITLGTRNVMIGVICTVVFCCIALYLAYARFGGRQRADAMLRFAMPAQDEQENLLRKTLRHYCRSFALVHLREAGPDGMEFAYQIKLFDPRQSPGLVADIGEIPGARGINLLIQDQDEEVEPVGDSTMPDSNGGDSPLNESRVPEFRPSMPRVGFVRRFRGLFLGLVPLAFWCGAIVAVFYLADRRPRPLEYRGLATVSRYLVVAPAQGKLEALFVANREVVTPGQLLGRIDGSELAVQARRVGHDVSRLRAELVRERELHDEQVGRDQEDRDNDLRRFTRDVENARLDALEVQASLEESRIRLEGLRIDLERQKGLMDQRLFSEAELIRTKTEYDALGERIKRTESVLTGHNERLGAVEARLRDYESRRQVKTADMGRVLGAYQWRIAAEETELEMIALARTRLELRAPAAGVVSIVHARSGEIVPSGRPVLTIEDQRPGDLVLYVPEADIGTVRPGMPVMVERSTAPGTVVRTTVGVVGQSVVELPERVQTDPRVPEWGVPVHLVVPAAVVLLPGETIRARILVDEAGG